MSREAGSCGRVHRQRGPQNPGKLRETSPQVEAKLVLVPGEEIAWETQAIPTAPRRQRSKGGEVPGGQQRQGLEGSKNLSAENWVWKHRRSSARRGLKQRREGGQERKQKRP